MYPVSSSTLQQVNLSWQLLLLLHRHHRRLILQFGRSGPQSFARRSGRIETRRRRRHAAAGAASARLRWETWAGGEPQRAQAGSRQPSAELGSGHVGALRWGFPLAHVSHRGRCARAPPPTRPSPSTRTHSAFTSRFSMARNF